MTNASEEVHCHVHADEAAGSSICGSDSLHHNNLSNNASKMIHQNSTSEFFLENRVALSHELSLLAALAFIALVTIDYFVRCALRICIRAANIICRASSNGVCIDESSTPKSKVKIIFTTLLFLIAIELPIVLNTPVSGLSDLIQGTDPLLNNILDRVPALQHGPSPPWLLRNRHVQFIPFMIQNEIHRREQIPFQRIEIEVTDCSNKMMSDDCDRMMVEKITLDIFPPFDDDLQESYPHFNQSSPVILYAPGLRCHSQDLPGNSIIRKAYGAGFRSIVMNRRGHTPDMKLSSPRWNLFGDVDDMEQIYWYVKQQLVTKDAPMFLYGISSGTAITVTALSKWDKRRVDQPDRKTPKFVASVDVSPGYDISKVLNRERFLWPYNDVLMTGVKDHFIIHNEELLRAHDNSAVDKALEATSLQEIVDASVSFAGYANTTQYYEDTNPINEVRDITTPKLVLNAIDDPCCNVNNLYEQSPYPQHEGKTFAQMIRETKRGMVAVTYTGSHCPFLCTRNKWLPFTKDSLNGGWMLNSWADEVTIEYYKAALDVYGR